MTEPIRSFGTPIFWKNSTCSRGGMMTVMSSPANRIKSPLGMYVWPPRRTMHSSTSVCSRGLTSQTAIPFKRDFSGMRMSSSSMRPFAKVPTPIADGKRMRRDTTRAVDISGLITMDRPSSSRIKPTSETYWGSRTRAIVWQPDALLAIRQARRLISSCVVTAISRSVSFTPASFRT